MVGFQKIVQVTDAVLDCVPIASTLSNAAQLIYQSAYKVDTHNPVAPGLKTSLQIHVLSKSQWSCYAGLVPVLGNILNLVKLVAYARRDFEEDYFFQAVSANNEEIVHLSLWNGELNDLERAEKILNISAHKSHTELFKKILNHRNDWDSSSLLQILVNYEHSREDKANTILEYFGTHPEVWDDRRALSLSQLLDPDIPQPLLGRLIETLPQKGALKAIMDLLLREDLTDANQHALIAKTRTSFLSFSFLETYWTSIVANPLTAQSNYLQTQCVTLMQLLEGAQLSPTAMGSFISYALQHSDSIHLTVIGDLVSKHEASFTPQTKKELLKSVFEGRGVGMLDGTKKSFFSFWIDQWKSEIAPLAHELCVDAIQLYKRRLENAEQNQSDNRQTEGALALSILPFKQVLLLAFPDCDQARS